MLRHWLFGRLEVALPGRLALLAGPARARGPAGGASHPALLTPHTTHWTRGNGSQQPGTDSPGGQSDPAADW